MEQVELAALIIKPSCANEPDLEERVRKAFKAAQNIWFGNDDMKFRGAVAAVLVNTTNEDEKKRLTCSYQILSIISDGLRNGVINADALTHQMPKGVELIPLVAMWREAKGQ